MTDKPVELDQYRGMASQKATGTRRLRADVEANEQALRQRRDELEAQLFGAPAASWREAADRARYLIGLYAATLGDGDTRHHALVETVLADFNRLESES
ncbi:hypothetical protein [Reyranella sp.]|uniref:hypothetical protein n=1 Tax=Reyranella sp. TaxID=1929291 RepID=UPI003BAB2758